MHLALVALLALVASGPAAGAPPEVPFLASPPPVDGVLEPELARSPARALAIRAGDAAGAEPPVLRLVHGSTYLHLAVEFPSGGLTARDRGYQNGDGLVVVLAEPAGGDAGSERFVVLAFSGGAANASSWARRLVWYENVGLAMRPAGAGVLFAERFAEGRAVFEVRIPWDEVQPFHPWLGPVGLNVMLVRATPSGNARNLLVADGRVDSEGSPRRSEPLRFALPAAEDGLHLAVRHPRNVTEGGRLALRVASSAAAPATVELRLRFLSGEGETALRRSVPLELPAGSQVAGADVDVADLVPSGYRVTWSAAAGSATASGEAGLTVLPRLDAGSARRALAGLGEGVASGSATTIRFLLEEALGERARLHPVDTAAGLFARLARVRDLLERARSGEDVLASRTGLFRRAFVSSRDSTLQPYSVRVPTHASAKRLPLVVYLHGSGQDDRALEGASGWIAGPEALVVAPFARGTSHAYDPPEAQSDIADAVRDAQAAYPVDPERLVLTGFSMGGYGVLRTFAADPQRYAALAVFSGEPDMGTRYGRAGAPSFLDPASLAPFRGVPVFLFHGRRDRNCPFEKAERLASALRAAGAKVTFVVEDVGHERPGDEGVAAYHAWLRAVTEGE